MVFRAEGQPDRVAADGRGDGASYGWAGDIEMAVVKERVDIARWSPDFWATCFPGWSFVPLLDLDIFLTGRSSTNTTAWFLLISFEDCCRKSFLMLAMRWCNLAIPAFTFFQLLENFFFRAIRRCHFASFGKHFLSGWHGSGSV